MPDYKSMYFKLAAKVADVVETLDKVSQDLKVAQMEGEDMFCKGNGTFFETKLTENIHT